MRRTAVLTAAALFAGVAIVAAAGGAPASQARPLECPEGNPDSLHRLDLGTTPQSRPVAARLWRAYRFVLDVSDDGRWIVYWFHGVVVVARSDGWQGRVVVRDGEAANAFRARFSPDGRTLALSVYTYRYSIWLVGSDGSGLRKLANDVDEPEWSPAGTQLAYVSRVPGEDPRRLLVARADGSRVLDVAPAAGSYGWSPDGKWIAYQGTRRGRLDLIHPDGSGHRVLHRQAGWPSWSPDGRRVVVGLIYDVDRGNAQDAFAVLDAATGRRIRAIEYGGASQAVWSPRSDEIVYALPEGHTYGTHEQLYGVRSDGTRRRQLTRDRIFPELVQVDWIHRIEWVTRGPFAGKRLFYLRNYCNDDSV